MGTIVKPFTYSSNTTISSSQANANLDTIYNEFNGSIAAANLATNAVTTAKIADSNVTTAKINDSAVTTAKINDAAVTPVKWTNPYKFRARRVAAQTITVSTQTKIAFDTEDFDSNNNHSGGTYTAPVAGFYHFTGYCNIAGGTNIMSLYKNGALYQRGTQAASGGITSSFLVQSAASDTWEIWIFVTSGASLDVTANLQPYFDGFLVSQT